MTAGTDRRPWPARWTNRLLLAAAGIAASGVVFGLSGTIQRDEACRSDCGRWDFAVWGLAVPMLMTGLLVCLLGALELRDPRNARALFSVAVASGVVSATVILGAHDDPDRNQYVGFAVIGAVVILWPLLYGAAALATVVWNTVLTRQRHSLERSGRT